MSRITDYAFLFQKSFGTSGVNAIGSFQLSQLNSTSVQSQLKAALELIRTVNSIKQLLRR